MKKTQQQRILDYINTYGSITSLDASNMLILDLQGNIQQLEKKGYRFDKERVGSYKRYSLQTENVLALV